MGDLAVGLYFAFTLLVQYVAVWRGLRLGALRALAATAAWVVVSVTITLTMAFAFNQGIEAPLWVETVVRLVLDTLLVSVVVALWAGLTRRVVLVVGIVNVATEAVAFLMPA